MTRFMIVKDCLSAVSMFLNSWESAFIRRKERVRSTSLDTVAPTYDASLESPEMGGRGGQGGVHSFSSTNWILSGSLLRWRTTGRETEKANQNILEQLCSA